MIKKRFVKDRKIKQISIKEFYENSNYLVDIRKRLWKDNTKPKSTLYYKITPKYLIKIFCGSRTINFGQNTIDEYCGMQLAVRDGKTEFELLDSKLKELTEKKEPNNKKQENEIKNINSIKRLLSRIAFNIDKPTINRNFEDSIIDLGYKTSISTLKNKYVVIDVETNGLRPLNDDLLSISIYDPSTGKCYNRFLPLDLQPIVLTGWIHGITNELLDQYQHLTQAEIDKIIDYFDLKNKILLSYSGGKGLFDTSFIINYCKRHNISGFENLHYENIKSDFPSPGFGFAGKLSKDNLCKLLNIEGTSEVHSSINDCLLEWKLFEKIKDQPLFFINQNLYKYQPGYIIPVSYLNRYPILKKFTGISIPNLKLKMDCIFNFSLSNSMLKKFPTNITGISLENTIYAALNVKKQDNIKFMTENFKKLEYIGMLENTLTTIPVMIQNDGTLKSYISIYDNYINEINHTAKIITDALTPVFDFIKEKIFKNNQILCQEMVISNDRKALALCDLSDDKNVLEIKTCGLDDEEIKCNLAKQLYFQSNGRNIYVLTINFSDASGKNKNQKLTIQIYKTILEQSDAPIIITEEIEKIDKRVLRIIANNPYITITEISKKTHLSFNGAAYIIKKLKYLKYIMKEDETKRKSKWIILRDINDTTTKLSYFDGKKTVL